MHNYRYDLPRSGTGYLKYEGVSPFQPDSVYCVTSNEVLSPEHIKHVQQGLEKTHSVRLAFYETNNGRHIFKEVV